VILLEGGAREVVGVETAGAVVQAAQAAGRPGLRFERADPAALPYPDDAFDGAVCLDLGEAGDVTEPALAELDRVLAPAGLLAVSVAGPAAPDALAIALRRRWPSVRVLSQRNWIGSGVVDDGRPGAEEARVHGLAGGEPVGDGHWLALAASASLPDPGPPVLAMTGLLELRGWLEHSDRQQRALEEQRLRIQELGTMEMERAQLRGRLIAAEEQAARVVALEVELEAASRERDDLRTQIETSRQILRDVMSSPSWRITKPLRMLKRLVRARLD
jgi:SAM-dependent methyltransferase